MREMAKDAERLEELEDANELEDVGALPSGRAKRKGHAGCSSTQS